MYLKLGNTTNAMGSLIQAKTLKPNDVSVNRQLAALYASKGLEKKLLQPTNAWSRLTPVMRESIIRR